jgi:hypothetical protein
MSPSELNDVFRLVWLAERCGPECLDNLQSLDGVFGRCGGAKFNGDVLDVVRGIVKTIGDGGPQFRAGPNGPLQNAHQNRLNGERFGG